MSRELKLGLLVLALACVGVVLSQFLAGFPGAREAPSQEEVTFARRMRIWTMPRVARNAKNPFTATPALLQEAERHFADHCASCHGNNGSGATEMGQKFFPRVPDMRANATQRLSDGELYYFIHNGIRWTGMPAWGDPGGDMDSWKLVLFIRHLPQLTPQEQRDMERFNPRSIVDQEEEKKEEDFLNGGAPTTPQPPKSLPEKTK